MKSSSLVTFALFLILVSSSTAQQDRINELLSHYGNRTAIFFSHYLGGGAGYLRGRFASGNDRKACESVVGYTGELVGSTVAGLSTSVVKGVIAAAGLATIAASFGGSLGFCILGPPGSLPGAALAGSLGAVVGGTGGFLFEFVTTESFENGGNTGKKAAIEWTCPIAQNCTIDTKKAMNDGNVDKWPLLVDAPTDTADGNIKLAEGEQLKVVCNGTGNYFVNFDYLLQELTIECRRNETFTQDGMEEDFYDFYCKENPRSTPSNPPSNDIPT